METLGLLGQGFAVALTPTNLLFVFVGVFLGQVIGALPGIGPSLGMVLLLPISFGLTPVTAIVMLSGFMYGAMYGGTLTSVLINKEQDLQWFYDRKTATPPCRNPESHHRRPPAQAKNKRAVV